MLAIEQSSSLNIISAPSRRSRPLLPLALLPRHGSDKAGDDGRMPPLPLPPPVPTWLRTIRRRSLTCRRRRSCSSIVSALLSPSERPSPRPSGEATVWPSPCSPGKTITSLPPGPSTLREAPAVVDVPSSPAPSELPPSEGECTSPPGGDTQRLSGPPAATEWDSSTINARSVDTPPRKRAASAPPPGRWDGRAGRKSSSASTSSATSAAGVSLARQR